MVPLIRLSNGPIYLDRFETANSHNMAFQFGTPNYAVVRRTNMHHQGPGQDGANSAFIMVLSNYGSPAIGTVIQDNTFSDITYGTGNCALKMYSLNKSLIEDGDPAGRWVSGSRIHFENVTDGSRIFATNDLEGSPSQNITDATGNLSGPYDAYFGTHGWQLRVAQPAPGPSSPRLESPKIQPNGSFQFRLTNAPAASYVIRASTDLIQWLPIATNQVSNGGLEWEDSETSRYPFRFYRVVSP